MHRFGRTARAGAWGEAISFACDEFVFSMPDIEEYIGHKIPVEQITRELLVEPKAPVYESRPERVGQRGNQRGKKKTARKKTAHPHAKKKQAQRRPPRKKQAAQHRHKAAEPVTAAVEVKPGGLFKRIVSKLTGS